jgi:hypothetical protein
MDSMTKRGNPAHRTSAESGGLPPSAPAMVECCGTARGEDLAVIEDLRPMQAVIRHGGTFAYPHVGSTLS